MGAVVASVQKVRGGREREGMGKGGLCEVGMGSGGWEVGVARERVGIGVGDMLEEWQLVAH